MTQVLLPLPRLLLEDHVRAALKEDLGRAGDITAMSTVPADRQTTVEMAARQEGVIAGLDLAVIAFEVLDPNVEIMRHLDDGSAVAPGAKALTITGNAQAVLSAERTALNFVSHLSGIASATAKMVAAAGDHKARITCTRKTTPGLRALEKYAVRAGGGANHRFGLDDGVLIKDNHIAIVGSVKAAVEGARHANGHMVKIELEVDTLDQLREALTLGVEAVLLDNMTTEQMAEAVAITQGQAVLEASGRMSLDRVGEVAATGVDLISVGALTHSSPILDVGLDFVSS